MVCDLVFSFFQILNSFFFKNYLVVDFFLNFKDFFELVELLEFQPIQKSNLEKFANYNIFATNTDVWSLIALDTITTALVILILILPLIFCILVVFFFFLNQLLVQLQGKIHFIEYRELNFLLFTNKAWWTLWTYAYYFTPRYNYPDLLGEIDEVPNEDIIRYPNTKHALYLLYNIFLTFHRPQFLRSLTYIGLLFLLLTEASLNFSPLFFASFCFTLYLDDRWQRKRWPLGYRLFWLISYFQKKFFVEREDYFEKAHLNTYLAFYPVFLSFLLFILVTGFVFLMYFDFFFKPVLVWNGYFSNTIISFFFCESAQTYWISTPIVFDYFVAFDGLNIWLIWLTSLLTYLCALFLLDTIKLHSFFSQLGWIFLLEFASFQFFCVPNYLWMYIYFELSLLPIFILIVFWGSNRRKVHAAYQMVLFTFVGSLFLLAGVFLLFIKIWSFNSFDIFYVTQSDSLHNIFSNFEKKTIWLLLFIGFAVKTPLYPFHIWLPEAHSEAPTTGSVLLAGVLLKMGTYGFLWFVIPLFPSVLETFKTLVFSMCLCGILLSSLAALAQIDIKKIIAYSSIGHMGLVIIGIYTLNMNGLLGASYTMLSHGLISSALFFSIGILYKIYGTRSIVYYNSLAHFMPRFSMCFFVFSLANMSFPGTAGFPGELLIFASMMADNFFLSLFVGLGSIFGGIYSIWLLTRVLYGQISPKIAVYRDVKPSERKILNFLFILILLFGIFPFFLLDFFKPMCGFFVALANT